MASHWISPPTTLEEKPKEFQVLLVDTPHWVIRLTPTFDPKKIECNSVMLNVKLERRGDNLSQIPSL